MKKKRIGAPVPIRALSKLWKIMRLSVFFLLLFVAQTFATATYSQQTRLTLKMQGAKVIDVLGKIEDQSQFYFLFNQKLVDVERKVDVDAKNESVEKILNGIFGNTNVSYLVKDRQIILTTATPEMGVLQQQKSVSGKVTDSSGSPLPGVSVVIKSTTNGTITDGNGNYSLSNVPENAIVQFSFVGMKGQEVAVGNKTTISVTMAEDAIGIEEVVAIGYGTQKKVNLTGSVAAITIDEKMTSRNLTNVSSGLSGMLPGLSVSQNSGMAGKNDVTMLIRGLGSTNNANPLIVVDGMPDVDINRLNANDIESVSVLKDATSSAVYGSRGANGVILITTKSGKGMKKGRVNYSSNFALVHPTKAYDFMADYPRALTLHQRNSSVNTLRSNLLFKDGTIDQWLALGMIDPLRYPNTDVWDIIMRNGQVQNHNVSASGGNEISNFFISLGVMDEEGLQINNDYTRYNGRFNYDYKVRQNMNIGAKFAGNWSKYVYELEEGFTGADMQYAIAGITPYDPATGLFGGTMAYNEDPQAYSPYMRYHQNLNRENRQEANVSTYWDWTPFKGFTARVDYAINYYNEFRYNAAMPTRSFNFQTNSYGSRIYNGDNSGVENYTNSGYKTQLNGRLDYATTIADNHEISALFVYSEEYWYNRYQMSSRNDRLHPSLHEIDAALTDIVGTGGNSNEEGLSSYIGRINYAAFGKYLFEANFRYDGSSKFLEGSRYGFFPSASVGWRFTEEDFIKSFTDKFLTTGKLRFSYGGLGNNSGVGRYEQQEVLDSAPYMIGGAIQKGFVYKQMVNQRLSWESTYVLNLGLDLGFLNNRLTSEIDYYDRLTVDMLRPSDMSLLLTGAYNAPRQNIGELRNRGIEGNFNWKDKIRDFNYSINLNGSYNRTVLEKWNEYLGKGNTFLNMPYHFVYGYEDIGIAQTWQDVYNATPQGASPGDIIRLDLNGDGRITGEDRKADPNVQRDRPTTNFAMNLAVEWKGFDISLLLQGAAGRKTYWLNIYNNVNFSNARYASTWDHWNEPWNWENREGEWPRLGGNSNREETTFYLDNLAYLRFKNLQMGYTLPNSWLQKAGIASVRIYGTTENFGTLTKFRGLDPEKLGDASDAHPLNKSFSLGINIGI